jgi:integrase/recombinase XerD
MKKIEMRRKTDNVTVGDAFDLFIRKCKVKNLSDYSILAYQKKCEEFLEMVGKDSPVTEIDCDAVDDFILELRERDITDITIQTIMRHVRAYVYYCQEAKYIPVFKVTVPKADKKIKETYSNEELMILLKKPNVDKCSFSEYKTWAFENYLLATGNRISTALNVKIKDVDFQNGTLLLAKTKSRRQQVIPLSNSLAIILKEYLEIRGGEADDYLFCNEYGAKASERTYQQLVRRYNIKRNVNTTSCHCFRHTFAKNWVLNSGDIARLKTILGHSSLAVTNEYLQMFGQDLQMDFERFNPLDNLVGRR